LCFLTLKLFFAQMCGRFEYLLAFDAAEASNGGEGRNISERIRVLLVPRVATEIIVAQ
jgi:hypothetical protein